MDSKVLLYLSILMIAGMKKRISVLLVGETGEQQGYVLEEYSCICIGSFSMVLLNANKK